MVELQAQPGGGGWSVQVLLIPGWLPHLLVAEPPLAAGRPATAPAAPAAALPGVLAPSEASGCSGLASACARSASRLARRPALDPLAALLPLAALCSTALDAAELPLQEPGPGGSLPFLRGRCMTLGPMPLGCGRGPSLRGRRITLKARMSCSDGRLEAAEPGPREMHSCSAVRHMVGCMPGATHAWA